LTLALMDPPYESANTTTALRIIDSALQKGIRVRSDLALVISTWRRRRRALVNDEKAILKTR